jgi:divinyl protochlorophyllide a 8-vinyl-reductase
VTRGGGPPTIGPNALIQTAAALRALEGEAATVRVFAHAGLAHRLAVPPAGMVPACEAAALMASLAACLPAAAAAAVAAEGGRRTGDYILTHRIPPLAQRILRAAPQPVAARVLGRAIAAHAWTFAGGASARARSRRGAAVIEINDEVDALTQTWRCAVLARLFAALVAPRAEAVAEDRAYVVALN